MKLPGTVPPYVQYVYWAPSAIGSTTSLTVRFTRTRAGFVRFVGGGTFGGDVSVATTGWSGGSLVTSGVALGAGGARRNLMALELGASWHANAARLKATAPLCSAVRAESFNMHG